MKKILITVLTAVFIFLNYSTSVSAATDLPDGTYTVDYLILHADNDSVSIANDYWEKPATVIVNGDNTTVQLMLNHSKWVTEYKAPSGGGFSDVKVVSTNEGNDTRVVEFSVADLGEIIPAKIHVTVPDIDYDHDYTIRHSFDLASAKPVAGNNDADNNNDAAVSSTDKKGNESANKNGNSDQTNKETTENKVDNPKTGDTTYILGAFILLAASGIFLITRFRTKRS